MMESNMDFSFSLGEFQMEIVIAGAGKLGELLLKDLSGAGYDVTLIELNPDRLEQMINSFDVTGGEGNGALYDVQEEAGVSGCDLFIAAMPQDESNIIAGITAHKLGARFCVTRVRSPEFSKQMGFLRESMGIDVLIHPDLEAARDIARNLGFPTALELEHFDRGRVNIVTYPLPKDSPLRGKQLKDLKPILTNGNICAIERDGQVFICNGQSEILDGDHLHVTGTTRHLNEFYERMGGKRQRMDNILIIGASRITHYLLPLLARLHIRAKVIEVNPLLAEQLAAEFPEVEVIQGDGTDQEFLRQERVSNFDAVVALTGIDEENILVSIYASRLKVPKTITKVNRTALLDVLNNVGLQAIVTPRVLISDQMLRLARSLVRTHGSNIQALYRIAGHRLEALQIAVDPEARIIGHSLKNLPLKDNVMIAAITRNDQVIYPSGNDSIEAGDHVIITTTHQGYRDIDDILED